MLQKRIPLPNLVSEERYRYIFIYSCTSIFLNLCIYMYTNFDIVNLL